jgi:hypothetical protein
VHHGVGADTQPSPTVIPAKAGIQLLGFLEKLDPGFRRDDEVDYWIRLVVPELAAKPGRIPASAGMTTWVIGYAL